MNKFIIALVIRGGIATMLVNYAQPPVVNVVPNSPYYMPQATPIGIMGAPQVPYGAAIVQSSIPFNPVIGGPEVQIHQTDISAKPGLRGVSGNWEAPEPTMPKVLPNLETVSKVDNALPNKATVMVSPNNLQVVHHHILKVEKPSKPTQVPVQEKPAVNPIVKKPEIPSINPAKKVPAKVEPRRQDVPVVSKVVPKVVQEVIHESPTGDDENGQENSVSENQETQEPSRLEDESQGEDEEESLADDQDDPDILGSFSKVTSIIGVPNSNTREVVESSQDDLTEGTGNTLEYSASEGTDGLSTIAEIDEKSSE
jgi:hypothetical protein